MHQTINYPLFTGERFLYRCNHCPLELVVEAFNFMPKVRGSSTGTFLFTNKDVDLLKLSSHKCQVGELN